MYIYIYKVDRRLLMLNLKLATQALKLFTRFSLISLNSNSGCVLKLYLQVLYFPVSRLLLKTPLQGSQTSIFLATESDIEPLSGKYFADCCVKIPGRDCNDVFKAKRLWNVTEKLLECS